MWMSGGTESGNHIHGRVVAAGRGMGRAKEREREWIRRGCVFAGQSKKRQSSFSLEAMENDDDAAKSHRWRMGVPTGVDGAAMSGRWWMAGGGTREWKKAMWWNWSGLPKDKNGSNWTADGRWLASAKLSKPSWALASRAGKGRAREPSGVQWQARASRPLPFWFRRLLRDSAGLSTCIPNSLNMAVFGLFLLEDELPNYRATTSKQSRDHRMPSSLHLAECAARARYPSNNAPGDVPGMSGQGAADWTGLLRPDTGTAVPSLSLAKPSHCTASKMPDWGQNLASPCSTQDIGGRHKPSSPL